MSIGQFGTMGGLIAAYHLNANANDFSGSAYHGTDTDITYDPVTGILGPGAKFDGDSSKIVLPAGLWTPMANATFSIAVVVQLPASAPGTQPIFGRSRVQISGGDQYGYVFALSSNSIYYHRGCGYDTLYQVSATVAFESSKRYLLGLTYNHSTGYGTVYCVPLYAGLKLSQGTADIWMGDATIYAPNDQGLCVGANLRNTSNQYSTLTMNEFLVFNRILPLKWYVDYAAYLRGFK